MQNSNEKIFKDLVKTFIGFDPDTIMQSVGRAVSFPKYEIVKNKTTGTILLRVLLAGYHKDEINIEQVGTVLSIEHKKPETIEDNDEFDYLTDPVLAKRSFTLRLSVADYLKLDKAKFVDGILLIEFTREESAKKKVDIE